MTAYYNEFNKNAAAWLRELIAENLIAPGVVDERSIEDVTPGDLAGFTQCHFFAGIGGWSLALRLAGVPDSTRVWTGSAPCQPFSEAGKGTGFDDERHLWPHLHYLARVRRPPALLGEQSASKTADPWFDLVQADMEALGYAFGAVAFPSAGIGAPHLRDRGYWGAADTLANPASARLQGRAAGRHPRPGREGRAAERDGAAGLLANAHQLRLESQAGAGLHHDQPDAEPRRSAGGLADTGGSERGGRSDHGPLLGDRQTSGWDKVPGDAQRGGESGLLADTHAAGLQRPEGAAALAYSDWAHEWLSAGDRAAGQLADATRGGRLEGSALVPGNEREGHGPAYDGLMDDRRPGPANGYWRDADWLGCRDGKWRAAEPGTQPLVDGIPASMGALSPGLRRVAELAGFDNSKLRAARSYRVAALQGFGNAVNVYAAAAFIEAFKDHLKGK